MTLPAAAESSSSRLALLVDRDPDLRKLYAEHLRLGAWRIDEADDGAEALALAISHRPSIIVTDTSLPSINGYDLCRLLRRDSTTQHIPLVVVTADAQADHVARVERVADRVLIKPCRSETLLGEIRQLLASSSELRARSTDLRQKAGRVVEKSERLIDRSREHSQRYTLSRAIHRHDTTSPEIPPPSLICPQCDQPLAYRRSHIGGVSEKHPEQWDYFECQAGCGTFQYRERTRRLRKV